MTREEAIKTLRELLRETNDPWYEEVYNMAIEALADRPTGEWISEELANMICNEICYYKEVTVDADSLNDLCEGCLIKKMKYGRPTGEWIIEDAHTEHCSVCGYAFYISALFAVGGNDEPNYCPNCGAKMYKGGDEE